MKLVAMVLLIHPLLILGFSALAVSMQAGLDGITNPGFHGLRCSMSIHLRRPTMALALRDWQITACSGT